MSNDAFIFYCPACGAKLTLALRLAGIVGPCPSCQAQIQAPTMEALMIHAQATASYQAAPASAPAGPSAEASAQSTAAAGPQSKGPNHIEPRQLPKQSDPAEIVSRPISEDIDRPRTTTPGPPPRRRRSGPLRRALVPIIFLAASVALVVSLVILLTTPPPTASRGESPAGKNTPVRRILPEDPPVISDAGGAKDNGEEAVQLVPLASNEDRGHRAMRTLETFLAASSLAERLPLIETSISPEQLEKSCLAGKLPPSRFDTLIQESNDIEKLVDCYYSVRFRNEDGTDKLQTMLVRIRGDAPPKVVVDPFLDLYGGRLKAFFESPENESGKFQVVLSPMRYGDFSVPEHEKKLFLKLLTDSADPNPIGCAATGLNGPIGKMVADPSSGLRWGTSKCCTVILQWNRDDPAKPYVEALGIASLDWNP